MLFIFYPNSWSCCMSKQWKEKQEPHMHETHHQHESASSYVLGTLQLDLTRPTMCTRDLDCELLGSYWGPQSSFARVGWSWTRRWGCGGWSRLLWLSSYDHMTGPPVFICHDKSHLGPFSTTEALMVFTSCCSLNFDTPAPRSSAAPLIQVFCQHPAAANTTGPLFSAPTHGGSPHVHTLPHCLPSFPTSPRLLPSINFSQGAFHNPPTVVSQSLACCFWRGLSPGPPNAEPADSLGLEL